MTAQTLAVDVPGTLPSGPVPPGGPVGTLPAARAAERPRAPWVERFAGLLVLPGGIVAYVATFAIMVLTRNSTMIPTVLLVGAATIPLTVLLLAQCTRYGALVPSRIVLVTAAAGGLLGICAAGLEEAVAAAALGRASVLLVGVIEETAKLVVPLVVLALAHRVTRGGGLVVGIASATGFAVLETMGYGFNALLEKGGGLGALDATLVLRGVLVPAGHVAWTGAICAALWFLVETSHKARGALALAVAYVGAIVLHTAWDATGGLALHVAIGLLSVGTLLVLIIVSHRAVVRRERAAASTTA